MTPSPPTYRTSERGQGHRSTHRNRTGPVARLEPMPDAAGVDATLAQPACRSASFAFAWSFASEGAQALLPRTARALPVVVAGTPSTQRSGSDCPGCDYFLVRSAACFCHFPGSCNGLTPQSPGTAALSSRSDCSHRVGRCVFFPVFSCFHPACFTVFLLDQSVSHFVLSRNAGTPLVYTLWQALFQHFLYLVA